MARHIFGRRQALWTTQTLPESIVSSVLRLAIQGAFCLLAVALASDALIAQTLEQFLFEPALLVCMLPPPAPTPPAPWPVAATDSLVGIAGVPMTFTRAALLANDTGATLSVVGVIPTSTAGATIAGTDPLTYTPPPTFAGNDVFAYEISDEFGQSTTGIVKVSVVVDRFAPTVTIAAPGGGTVSGTVVISATATDNVAVAGVTFFDGTSQIAGEDVAAPFEAPWNTTPVPDGTHHLLAVARDASGNTASAGLTVTVLNTGPPAMPSGLVLALGFDETSGTTAFDRSGGNQHGVVSGAVPVPGKAGGALQFDGRDDFVTVADSAALDLTLGMTLSAWVNPSAFSGWETVMLKERGVGALAYALYAQDGGTLGGGFDGPAGTIHVGSSDHPVRGTSALPLHLWTHLATTYDGAVQRIYVDGVLAGSRPQTGSIAVSSGALRIGGNNSWADEFFAGLLDEVRVYNRALSAAEIEADMNLGPLPAPPNSPPSAGPDSLVTAADTPLSFTAGQLTANDRDPDGDAINVTSVAATTAAGGSVTSTSPASWTYTPRAAFSGADSFTYVVADTRGGSATGMVTVTVTSAASGLVAAYSFNEGSGTTANDLSGNGKNGTIRGAQFAVGKSGTALQFDGVDDWVTIPDGVTGSPLDLTTAMTLSAWVHPFEFTGWETIVMKERGAGALAYALYAQDGGTARGGADAPAGTIRAGAEDQSVRGTSPVPLHAWTHVATTYDGVMQRIYVNGVLVASRAQTGTIAVSNNALRIGGNNSWADEFFNGLIDDVRVYNRALTGAQITADMNTPLP